MGHRAAEFLGVDEFREGDVFAANDPYHGGGHLPDYNVFAPVFADDGTMYVLRGDGIRFARTRVELTVTPDRVEARDGVAYGPGLGLKVEGAYDRNSELVDFVGMVAPAYSLSRLIDNVLQLARLNKSGPAIELEPDPPAAFLLPCRSLQDQGRCDRAGRGGVPHGAVPDAEPVGRASRPFDRMRDARNSRCHPGPFSIGLLARCSPLRESPAAA